MSQRIPTPPEVPRSLDYIASQNASGLLPYVAGSLGVWTGCDYIGESEWPDVLSSFGQFDISGLPKPSVYWYRAN